MLKHIQEKQDLVKAGIADQFGRKSEILEKGFDQSKLHKKIVTVRGANGQNYQSVRWVHAETGEPMIVPKTSKHFESLKGEVSEKLQQIVDRKNGTSVDKIRDCIGLGVYNPKHIVALTGADPVQIHDTLKANGITSKMVREAEDEARQAYINNVVSGEGDEEGKPSKSEIEKEVEALLAADGIDLDSAEKGDDKYKNEFTEKDAKDTIQDKFTDMVAKKQRKLAIFYGVGGVGKGLKLSTKILTPNGFMELGVLKQGDKVTIPDGSSVHILKVFPQGIQPIYELELEYLKVQCDINHLWKVTSSNEEKLLTVKELLELDYTKYYIPVSSEDFKSVSLKLINKITYVGEGETTCILINSNEGLFLIDDYIITHNTYGVKKVLTDPDTLDDQGKPFGNKLREYDSELDPSSDEYDFVKYTGKVTPAKVFKVLYEHNGKTIMFDDCDSILQDPDAVNMLKAATDTTLEDVVYEGHNIKIDDVKIPERFKFRGQIIVISNLTENELRDKASPLLESRALSLDVSRTMDETIDKLDRIKEKLPFEDTEGNEIDVPTSDKSAAIDFIKKYKNHMPITMVNGRTLGALALLHHNSSQQTFDIAARNLMKVNKEDIVRFHSKRFEEEAKQRKFQDSLKSTMNTRFKS